MHIGPTRIIDAEAEAFEASYARLLVTAADNHWLDAALSALCGYGTSVIGCDCEIGVDSSIDARSSPDGRCGAVVLAFAFSQAKLQRAVANRIGQALLTCPTVALFDGLPTATCQARVGDHLRYFGDGHEQQERDGWNIPTMEGEVWLPGKVGIQQGVGGGNLILQGDKPSALLAAARRAVESVADVPGVITPFPGGVCRSGSQVGSRYQGLVASTNVAFCPTLPANLATGLVERATCAYEVILNGVDLASIRQAMHQAMHAAAGDDVLALTAGNYGGKLGKIRIALRELAHESL